MHSTLTSELLDLCHWPKETKKNLRHKSCLWHTPTLTPIFTHDKLEPIMASIHFSPIIPGPASTDSLTVTTSARRENEGVNGEQGENLTSTDSLTSATSAGRENEGVNGEQGENLTSTASAGRENEGVNGEQGENLTSTESVQWRKYRFVAMQLTKDWGFEYCEKRSWPRLPYPRVDGLHLMSYLEFLGALECFIDPLVVANVFHIRATPIDSRCNEDVYWSRRKVVKKCPQLVDIYKELLESLQR